MKRILLGTALAHMTLMSAAETGSPAGGAATPASDAAPAAPATDSGTRIRPNVSAYQTAKTPGGSSTKICGDEVSLALLGATLDEAYGFVSKVVATPESDLRAKYGDKNLGQQRMFLGNLIRGAQQTKDEAKKARVAEAFAKELPEFRKVIDDRMAEEQKARDEAKAAKEKAKADAKAAKDKQKADDKAAREAAAKAKQEAADAAKTKPADTKPAAAPAAAKPAAAAPQAKGPGAPQQPK